MKTSPRSDPTNPPDPTRQDNAEPEAVSERRDPWGEDGVLVVPVYEEQLVVSNRLILK